MPARWIPSSTRLGRGYRDLDNEFDSTGSLTAFKPSEVVLAGHDTGITNLVNSKYQMTGSVEVAAGPFVDWLGRQVYMSGEIEWDDSGAPKAAPGSFRLH